MKLGIVSAILGNQSYEEVIDIVAKNGMECVELACWPRGKSERRYAGVSHVDVYQAKENKDHILGYAKAKGVTISALAYYPNVLDADQEVANAAISHLYQVIDAASELEVNVVTTFLGRDQWKSVEENIELAVSTWQPILEYALGKNVRIAIENCPMLFTKDEWPGGKNIFTTPSIWRTIFERLPYPNLGINYDPSHFVWQQMDYIAPLYEFKDRIFHVHYKDIKLFANRLKEVGVMALPLEYMAPKLPGLGDVKWGAFVSALNDIGYRGNSCIEVEDRSYEASFDDICQSIALSVRYLRNFVAEENEYVSLP